LIGAERQRKRPAPGLEARLPLKSPQRVAIPVNVKLLSLPMKCSARRKCQHCKEFYLPDRRNLHHRRYCAEPACRRQSKAESQRRWVQKPENQNYFSGSQNSQRVKEWRKRNPGYWRKKSPPPQEPLQDLCKTQAAEDEEVKRIEISDTLQDVLVMQPAVMVGLALHDDR
jgi:hypothetical protein